VIARNRAAIEAAEHTVGAHLRRWRAGEPTPCGEALDAFDRRWRQIGDVEGLVVQWPTLTCLVTIGGESANDAATGRST